jgi:hypothetical protein
MNKKYMIFASIAVTVVAIAALGFINQRDSIVSYDQSLGSDVVYTPSDITKANPNLAKATGHTSVSTTDIRNLKDIVKYTLRGKVLNVGDPIPWVDNAGNNRGAIPVEILVDKQYKGENGIGKTFTFYIQSIEEQGKYYVMPNEPTFEIGEQIVVHISEDENLGPDYIAHKYYVELGEYGKYKIMNNKAYNELYQHGVSQDIVGNLAK